MSAAEEEMEVQPDQDLSNEEREDRPRPETKSSVGLDPAAATQTGKFEKYDKVHMRIVQNGAQVKGLFTVHKSRVNPSGGWVEYQLKQSDGMLYENGTGEWVRENKLRMDKRA